MNSLAKILISSTKDTNNSDVNTQVTVGKGIQIKKAKANTIDVNLGDRMIDILRTLGNPNKDYRDSKTTTLYLNYLELGLDLAFSSGGENLEKIILHTNQFSDSYFAFYDRCFFEIDDSQGNITSLSKF